MKALLLVWLILYSPAGGAAESTVNVGSKRFTESYILGEIVTQAIRQAGEVRAIHQQGLGNTGIVFTALQRGAVDLYVDYTGTIALELLGLPRVADLDGLNRALARYGLGAAVPLGFSNTYALAMTEERAERLGIRRIAQLADQPSLRFGLSQEFLNRQDGWRALKARYRLPHEPRGLDHGLAYEALDGGQTDVVDVYSTDAKLTRYRLRQLEDDLGFFPPYDAVVLYRLDFPQRLPQAWRAVQKLEGRIDAATMAQLNAAAELGGRSFSAVAADFLAGRSPEAGADHPDRASGRSFLRALFAPDLPGLTAEHLLLVLASLLPAVALGIPLGIISVRSQRAGRWIMSTVGLLQTIPALALLAFLITLLGIIGTVPAVIALFLYALLPIVRNTATGLTDIAPSLRESAHALGLSRWARLKRVELPLASRSILAGIKTSAVIAVGTATIAAFVGAGGYGERIVAGLAVNDGTLLMAGALPAAALALLVQWSFDGLERMIVPRGLRLQSLVQDGRD